MTFMLLIVISICTLKITQFVDFIIFSSIDLADTRFHIFSPSFYGILLICKQI